VAIYINIILIQQTLNNKHIIDILLYVLNKWLSL